MDKGRYPKKKERLSFGHCPKVAITMTRSGLGAGPSENSTMEQIQFHIGANPISHYNKSNFTLEQTQFHIGTNLISLFRASRGRDNAFYSPL